MLNQLHNFLFGSSKRKLLEKTKAEAEQYKDQGNKLFSDGDMEGAEQCYRKAIAANPSFAEAHNNLGFVLKEMKLFEEAIKYLNQAIVLNEKLTNAYFNLGLIYDADNQPNKAIECLSKAIAIEPNLIDALLPLGYIYLTQSQYIEAGTCFQKILALYPEHFATHNNLGIAFYNAGRLTEATNCYETAIALQPDFAEAHNNLGIIFRAQKKLTEASICFQKALTIKPDYVEAHNNIGLVLKDMGKLSEAIICFQKAIVINPNYAEAHGNLGIALKNQGKLTEAAASYRQALMLKPDHSLAHSDLIFTLDLTVGMGISTLQDERKRWDRAHASHLLQRHTHPNTPDLERRLRIGYISADFRQHSAAYVFGPMLVKFDPSQFDVIAYSNTAEEDVYTKLFRQKIKVWRNIVDLSDDAVADLIRQDKVDILVDLSGHSGGNRLLVFARKPAPIQITAWGYIGGTGLSAMDIFFADPIIVPFEEKQFYAEQIHYLPNVVGYFCPNPFPEINDLPGLSAKIITFGSFNRLVKVTNKTLNVWAQVLLSIPNSRLVLKATELDNVDQKQDILNHFIDMGIDSDRITLLGTTGWTEQMTTFNQIDIALDPFPHGGGVTTLEGLMMGVPVVTLRWPTVVGRLSASILTTLGLTDWIAETQEEYIQLAVQKASDLNALAELRQKLRPLFTSSIIGDADAYVRAVETEYRNLWREWCQQQTTK